MFSQIESHVAVHLRCFLCDHELPETYGVPPPHPVVSLLGHGRTDTSPWSSTQVRNLARGSWALYKVPGGLKEFARHHTNPGLLFTYASTSAACGHCEPDKALFIAHWDCWKLVQRSGETSDRLYDFALQTAPTSPGKKEQHAPISVSELAEAAYRTTSLGELLVNIEHRLPEELRRDIMNKVQLHSLAFRQLGKLSEEKYKALLKDSSVLFTRLATTQASALSTLRHKLEAAENIVSGKNSERLYTMYIRTVQLFRKSYISQIGFNEAAQDPPSIPVRSEEIRGIRFALGRFGLRGLRILYADGSVSNWLGSTLGCWYGNTEGRSLRDLEVLVDGPRIVGIKLRAVPFSNPRIYSALLDHEIEAPCGELFAFLSYPDKRKPFFSTRHYPACKWKHICCLPLVFGSTYTSGLTMFWNRGTLRGMASYGPNNEIITVGSSEGEAVYFPLASGEYFTSLWVRKGSVQPPLVEPFLLTLGTSMGRSAHFGPQILLRPWMSTAMLRYRWEAVSSWSGPTRITGLLVEALSECHVEGHRGFGVVQEPLECSNEERGYERLTVYEIDVESPDPGDHFAYQETFRSTGSLDDVERIQMRRKAGRCVGMRIIHGTGLDDVLGSWDPADVSSVSTVYDSVREAPLATLIFHVRFKNDDLKPIIVNMMTGNSADSYLEHWRGRELMVIPVEEAGLVSDAELPDDFLVEFQCGQPEKMIAWYHDERTTEARSFTLGEETRIVQRPEADGLYALAWEPPIDRRRMWMN